MVIFLCFWLKQITFSSYRRIIWIRLSIYIKQDTFYKYLFSFFGGQSQEDCWFGLDAEDRRSESLVLPKEGLRPAVNTNKLSSYMWPIPRPSAWSDQLKSGNLSHKFHEVVSCAMDRSRWQKCIRAPTTTSNHDHQWWCIRITRTVHIYEWMFLWSI